MPKNNNYNRDKAVAYAHIWAHKRNPEYYNFDALGGDCTNFASQVLNSGGKDMDYKSLYGWYYKDLNNRTPSWSGVEFLYKFLTTNITPYAERVDVREIMYGDLIQLSFFGMEFQHTLVVVESGSLGDINNILVATHTYNSDYRPLSTYNWEDIRFLHII